MIKDCPKWVTKIVERLRDLDLPLRSKGWDVGLVLSHYRGTSTAPMQEWRRDLEDVIRAWELADKAGADFVYALGNAHLWPLPPDDWDADKPDEQPSLFTARRLE